MIDVNHQISAVRRTVGSRVLEAGEARVVTVGQSYATDAADLWDACTNIDRIPRWFLPITGDLKVGGQYQLEGNASGTILTCDPPRAFTATWEYGGAVSWIEVHVTDQGPDEARLELEHIAHVDDDTWRQFGPGAVGIGWDLGLVGLAIHLRTGESLDPTFGQQWTATEDGRRFMSLSSEAWFDAERRRWGRPRGGPGPRGSVRGGVPRGGVKLEHVLAKPDRPGYPRADECPDTCPGRLGDARPGRHRSRAHRVVGCQEVDPAVRLSTSVPTRAPTVASPPTSSPTSR